MALRDEIYKPYLDLRASLDAPRSVAALYNIFPLHDARRRRRILAKCSQLVLQLDDFITPEAERMSWEAHAEDWFGSLLGLPSFLLPIPPSLPFPFSRRVPSSCILALRRFNVRRMLHAMITNVGIPQESPARDKRTLTAYEQASALMVPTLRCRPTGFLSPFSFHHFFFPRALSPDPPSAASASSFCCVSADGPSVLFSFIRHPQMVLFRDP